MLCSLSLLLKRESPELIRGFGRVDPEGRRKSVWILALSTAPDLSTRTGEQDEVVNDLHASVKGNRRWRPNLARRRLQFRSTSTPFKRFQPVYCPYYAAHLGLGALQCPAFVRIEMERFYSLVP